MRRIAFSCGLVTLLTLTAALLYGGDVVDATRPANISEVERLLQRIEQLERRVRDLESRPMVAHTAPQPIPVLPHNHDGVLRADQVKIYTRYQRVIPDVQTAQQSR
jgi:hypothetical protein